jgi:excisionase family DNA binding protein
MSTNTVIKEMDKLLTVREVAEIIHVHPNTVRRWSDSGRIKFFRITQRGDRRYAQNDVISFLESVNNYFEKY